MAPLSIVLVTPPALEPITLTQAKSQLRVDYTDDDALIGGLIMAARQYAERYQTRRFLPQTWMRTLDFFPIWTGGGTVNTVDRKSWMYFSEYWNAVRIDIPGGLQSVTSITYLDPTTGDRVTLPSTDYVVDTTSIPGRIVPAQGMTWPVQTLYAPGSVQITYVAGYPTFQQVDLLQVPAVAPYSVTLSDQDVVSIASVMCNEPPPGGGLYLGPLPSALTAVSSLAALASGYYYYANGMVTVDSNLASTWLQVTYNTFLIPQTTVQAMLLLIDHWYNHRGVVGDKATAEVPYTVKALLDMEKMESFNYQ